MGKLFVTRARAARQATRAFPTVSATHNQSALPAATSTRQSAMLVRVESINHTATMSFVIHVLRANINHPLVPPSATRALAEKRATQAGRTVFLRPQPNARADGTNQASLVGRARPGNTKLIQEKCFVTRARAESTSPTPRTLSVTRARAESLVTGVTPTASHQELFARRAATSPATHVPCVRRASSNRTTVTPSAILALPGDINHTLATHFVIRVTRASTNRPRPKRSVILAQAAKQVIPVTRIVSCQLAYRARVVGTRAPIPATPARRANTNLTAASHSASHVAWADISRTLATRSATPVPRESIKRTRG